MSSEPSLEDLCFPFHSVLYTLQVNSLTLKKLQLHFEHFCKSLDEPQLQGDIVV